MERLLCRIFLGFITCDDDMGILITGRSLTPTAGRTVPLDPLPGRTHVRCHSLNVTESTREGGGIRAVRKDGLRDLSR